MYDFDEIWGVFEIFIKIHPKNIFPTTPLDYPFPDALI